MKTLTCTFFFSLFLLMAGYFFPKALVRVTLSPVMFNAQELPLENVSALDSLIMVQGQSINKLDRSNWSIISSVGMKSADLPDTLWVDRCEVTQQAYRGFLAWHGAQTKEKLPSSLLEDHRIAGLAEAPVAGIPYRSANAFCHNLGGRLPTLWEFYAISQDTDSTPEKPARLYAYGDQYEPKVRAFSEPWLNTFSPCHQQRVDITQSKIANLSSGVSEWVDSSRSPVALGGNGFDPVPELSTLTLIKREFALEQSVNYVGFRCVYDQPLKVTPWSDSLDTVKLTFDRDKPLLFPDSKFIAYLPTIDEKGLQTLFNQGYQKMSTRWFTEKEITVNQYQKFLLDPFVRLKFYANDKEPRKLSYVPENWQDQLRTPDKPVRFVDWWSAYAFANWLGGRLLTEREWLAIADQYIVKRRFESALNDWVPDKARGMLNGQEGLNGEEIPKQSMQWQALSQSLLKGVSEWTKTGQLQAGVVKFVVKGGNFMLPAETQTPSFSLYLSPDHRSAYTGFRVIFDD